VRQIVIVTLLWSEIMGGYSSHNGRDRSVKVGHEITIVNRPKC